MKQIQIKQNEMEISSFKLLKNGLEAIGNPSFEEWMKAGDWIKQCHGAVHFWIGDWLNYGESKYGETYTQAMDTTGYDYQTLSNDKWVANRIGLSRRRDDLSFEYHKIVADLLPNEQEEFLNKAIENKWNRN